MITNNLVNIYPTEISGGGRIYVDDYIKELVLLQLPMLLLFLMFLPLLLRSQVA